MIVNGSLRVIKNNKILLDVFGFKNQIKPSVSSIIFSFDVLLWFSMESYSICFKNIRFNFET